MSSKTNEGLTCSQNIIDMKKYIKVFYFSRGVKIKNYTFKEFMTDLQS